MKFHSQLILTAALVLLTIHCQSATYRGILSGIHCESCKKTVVESLGGIKGVDTVGLTPIADDPENFWVTVSTKGATTITNEKAADALKDSEHYTLSKWQQLPVAYMPVLPYEFLMEKLAGNLLEIRTIVGESDDCHDYSPTPKQVSQISKSNLIFSGDLGFEGNFFVKLGDGHDAPKQINLLTGLDLLAGSCAACEAAKAGQASAKGIPHNHDDLKDPHVWLSPRMLKQQAQYLTQELKTYLGETAHAELEQNLSAFVKQLDQVDAELRGILTPLKGQKFYVYHGAFAYFAADYGLEQVAIEIGNRKPTPRQLTKIANQAKQDGVKVVFVQPQFDQSSAKSLASAIGGEVAILDPLEKDVVANLRKIAASMKQVQ